MCYLTKDERSEAGREFVACYSVTNEANEIVGFWGYWK